MKLARWSVLCLFVAGLFVATQFSSSLVGGEKGKGVPPIKSSKTSKETLAAENAFAAFKMVKFGRDQKAPEALLAAARVIGRTKFTDLEPKDEKAGTFELINPVKEANALLDEAIKMSSGDDAVKKLAETIRKDLEGSRGAVGGPRTINGSVSGGDRRDTFPIRFKGGEQAFILVNNLSNRGDVDLYVQNDNGQTIARDRRADDDASVSFFVSKTQTYYVIVHCYSAGGKTPLRYRLTTN